MDSARIEIYTTSWCPYCERARALLRSKGAAFEDISIEADPMLREVMIRRSGRRSVPQIFIDGAHIGGSDELYALDVAGGLDPLLRTSRAPQSASS